MARTEAAARVPAKPRRERDYTTGQAATLTGLSIQTIIRCIDAGRLRGFRIPGSRFRRIPAASLRTFVTAYGLEMPPELELPLPPDLTAAC